MKKSASDEIVLVRLGKADWRISNPEGDLLGYVERQHADRYEVVWMTDPLRWGYADSFDAAIAAFGESVRFTGETADKRVKDEHPVTPLFAGRSPRRDTWVRKGRPHVA
jgi:hypothetical protein